jgi:UDP-glucose 4-epimerase
MGFVGSHLAEALLERGVVVTALDDLSSGRLANVEHLFGHPNFKFVVDSINNEMVLDRLASESSIIFHLAAAVGVELIVDNPVYAVENNVMGTEAVLKAAMRYHTKVLVTSTSEVYGKGSRVPFSEDDDVVLGATRHSRWAYAASKMIDEFLALAYHRQKGLPAVIVRLFNTVGPRQSGRYGMVVPRFTEAALRGEPLRVHGDGQQSRCFLHVHDAVEAIMAIAECEAAVGQVFNVGSTEEVSILELAQRVLALTEPVAEPTAGPPNPQSPDNSDRRIEFVPYEDAYGPGFEDMRRRLPDISKVREFVGWEPRLSLDQILLDIMSALKKDPIQDDGNAGGTHLKVRDYRP